MNKKKAIALVVLAGALNFVCIFAAPLAKLVWTAHQSATWPRAPGTVMRSSVEHGRGGRPRAEVSYTYEVSGQPYRASRIHFAGPAQDEASARAMSAQYGAGKAVNVFYKPSDPSEATLIPGLQSQIPVLMLAGGTLVMTGFLGVLFRLLFASSTRSGAS